MLCDVCLHGLEGMWDPNRTTRLAFKSDLESDDPDPRGKYLDFLRKRSQSQTSPATELRGKRPEVEMYIYGHHRTDSSWESSSEKGCVMCYPFEPKAGKHKLAKILDPGWFTCFQIHGLEESYPVMQIDYMGGSSGTLPLIPVGVPRWDRHLNFDFSSSIGDAKTWALIDNWLGECCEKHIRCRSSLVVRKLPTRLLKICEDSFILVSSDDIPSSERYITLSHCWGEPGTGDNPEAAAPNGGKATIERLKLLRTTHEKLHALQAISSLPKTFREAMGITSRLGIQYLWIDKLCIYQDSPDDWRAAANTMQDVYRNAFLNISALGAKNEDEGCFFDRDPRDIAPTIIRLQQTPDSEPGRFRCLLEKAYAWRLSFGRDPVAYRGWVVQERLLSPRVLHLGKQQVFWECREQNACELHPETVYCYEDLQQKADKDYVEVEAKSAKDEKPHLWKQLLNAPDRQFCHENAKDKDLEQLFLDWNSVIKAYARCDLTVPSDKLAAVSGLANDMKRALSTLRPDQSHRYFAGLWEDKLLDGTIWRVTSPAKRTKEYRAPSWSWASIDGSLEFRPDARDGANAIELATVWKAFTEHWRNLETGEIKGGFLKLMGPCFRMTVHPQDAEPSYSYKNERTVATFRILDKEDVPPSLTQIALQARVYFDDLMDVTDEAFCVAIKGQQSDEETFEASVLVLSQVDNCVDEEWKRIGIVSCKFKSQEDARSYFKHFAQKGVVIV
ncbi:MAG: hypothetical protein Q9157_005235 [Trypethelium eluteriae]